jgi:hypothetical protein
VLLVVCYIQIAAGTDLVNLAEAVAVNFVCNVLIVRQRVSLDIIHTGLSVHAWAVMSLSY